MLPCLVRPSGNLVRYSGKFNYKIVEEPLRGNQVVLRISSHGWSPVEASPVVKTCMTLLSQLISKSSHGTCGPELKRKETLKGQLEKNPKQNEKVQNTSLVHNNNRKDICAKEPGLWEMEVKIVYSFLCGNPTILWPLPSLPSENKTKSGLNSWISVSSGHSSHQWEVCKCGKSKIQPQKPV